MNRRRQRMLDVSLRINLGKYRLLIVALSPYLLGYTLWRAARDGGWRYLRQRLGFGYARPWRGLRPIWIHCASVGEVNAARPLVESLRQRRPDEPLLLTTNTPTAAAVVARLFPEGVQHAYLPLDLAGPVDLFVRRYRPRCGLILETELWANLYNACAVWEVPLAIVNGRLSNRTLEANAWLKAGYRVCFGALTRILARGPVDAGRFVELGATAEQVETLGSIKFAQFASEPAQAVLPGPYLLAVSTHDDEEARLARVWQALAPPGWVLVLAPRHPERREAILAALRGLGLDPLVRSRQQPFPAAPASGQPPAVYLADTLGEMPALLAGASLAFVGGSLIPRGGHNPIEPAAAGRAVICGPHMENFAVELAELEAAGGVVQVADEQELRAVLAALIADPERARRLGQAAAERVLARQGVVGDYLERLAALGLL